MPFDYYSHVKCLWSPIIYGQIFWSSKSLWSIGSWSLANNKEALATGIHLPSSMRNYLHLTYTCRGSSYSQERTWWRLQSDNVLRRSMSSVCLLIRCGLLCCYLRVYMDAHVVILSLSPCMCCYCVCMCWSEDVVVAHWVRRESDVVYSILLLMVIIFLTVLLV